MHDLLLLAVMTLVCTGVGLPAARLLPAPPFRARLLLAPTFGIAVVAVLVTVGYRFGLSPRGSLLVAAVAAAAGLALEVRRWVAASSSAGEADDRRALLVGVGTWLGALVILELPRFTGGDQFSIIQGNHWDTFGYLESALVFAREPFSVVEALGKAEYLRNPLMTTVAANVFSRPSVHLLYALFSRIAPGEAFRLHYSFLVFLISQAVLVTTFLVRTWVPRAPVAAVAAVAPVFALGFWGQWVFDINAWSQTSTVGIVLLLLVLFVDAAGAPRPDEAPGAGWRHAAAIAVLVAGATYLYPEVTLYYLAILVPLAGAAIGWRGWRAGTLRPARFVPLLGALGVVASVLYWKGIGAFVLGQFNQGTKVPVPWWHYFQAFLFGRTGEPGAPDVFGRVVDFAAGIFGLYFLTPPGNWPAPVEALLRLAMVAVLLALVVAVVRMLRGPPAPVEPKGKRAGAAAPAGDAFDRGRLLLAVTAGFALLVPAVRLVVAGQYWSAGKGLSFVAPVLMVLVALPLLPAGLRDARGLARVRWVTAAFVAFQLVTGGARVWRVTRSRGIHYSSPYPAIQDPSLKKVLRWDIDGLDAQLGGAKQVLVAPMNGWTAHFVMTYLYARGYDFFYEGPVAGNFGAGEKYGSMPQPWPGDARISLARQPLGLVVQYAGGRQPVLVAWPEPVR